VLAVDSRNSLVYADSRAVALVGVEDLVVIETADAVFICPRARAQEVKRIVEQLQRDGQTDLL
jgi:mannose-1-phosphate guanylyltransferase